MKRLLPLLLAACVLLAGCAPSYIEVIDTPTTSTLPTTVTTSTTTATGSSGTGTSTSSTASSTDGSNTENTASSSETVGTSESTETTTTTTTTTSTTKTTSTGTTVIPPVSSEHRALWVSTYANLDYPSDRTLSAKSLKSEWDTIVSSAAKAGINTLYFQVRPCGDALYPSAYFPSSRYVVASQGDPLPLDILDYAVTAAHNAGLKLYAWVNPVRVRAATDSKPLHNSNPAVLHPEWTFTSAGATYYNLGLPEVRTLIADGVAEIVQNYEVDGVIFDDYFYPYGSGITDAQDADAYAAYGGGLSRADFRRASVNRMLKACYDRIKAIDSNCQFGVSPFGIRLNSDAGTGGQQSYHTIYCDAVAWMSGGYVDFIAPQLYWSCQNAVTPYKPLADWWATTAKSYGVDFYPALAAYRYDATQVTSDVFTKGEIIRQVEYGRGLAGFGGFSLFRYYYLFENGVDDEINDLFA